MLLPKDFKYGENQTQFYYYYQNDVPGESINVIKNKFENHWWALYNLDDSVFIIPIDYDVTPEIVIERTCEWYNSGKERPERRKAPEPIENIKINKKLYDLENIFGNLSPHTLKRIQSFLEEPSIERWDDISSIIIDSNFQTIWQALTEYDPSFPKIGPTTNHKGEIINDWPTVPTPFQVFAAIRKYKKRTKEV